MDNQKNAMLSTRSANINFYALAVAFISLSTATVIFNTLALVAFVRLRYYRKASEFLLVLLSVVDLMTGLTTDALMAARFIIHLLGKTELSLQIRFLARLSGFSFSLMSVFTLIVICYEMYLLLLKPFFPPRKIGKIFVYHLVFLNILVLAVIVLSTDEVIWRLFQFSASVILILAYSTLCVIQFRILRETGRIAASRCLNYGQPDRTDTIMKRKSHKIARQILIAFGVAFIPYVIVMIFEKIWEKRGVTTNTYLRPWAFFFALTSSLVNPLLHSFRLKRVRKSLWPIFRTHKVASVSVTYSNTTDYHYKSDATHKKDELRHRTTTDHTSSEHCGARVEHQDVRITENQTTTPSKLN